MKAGSIQEVKYPDFLANTVIVKKNKGKMRVHIDFIDLNKACPNDSFPLPHIDRLVEATTEHKMLSFMRYNKIWMHLDDQEIMAFITDKGIYCYKVMPSGMKSASAT